MSDKKQVFRVKAKEMCFQGLRRIREGVEFVIYDREHFSEKAMADVKDDIKKFDEAAKKPKAAPKAKEAKEA